MPKKGKILKPILDIEAAVMARCNIFLGLSTASANVKTKTNELIGSLQLHTVNVVDLNQKFDQINAILKGFNGEVDQIKKDYVDLQKMIAAEAKEGNISLKDLQTSTVKVPTTEIDFAVAAKKVKSPFVPTNESEKTEEEIIGGDTEGGGSESVSSSQGKKSTIGGGNLG